MEKTMPLGITIIYFNDQSKNIYAELPPDKEQAKGCQSVSINTL